jgi:membrane-bound lytic murein transglycosylase B
MRRAALTRIDAKPLPPIGPPALRPALGRLMRTMGVLVVGFVVVVSLPRGSRAAEARDPQFQHFLGALWTDAHKQGVSRSTFNAAFIGVTPDPAVIARTRKQAEFVKPIGDYLTSAVSQKRIEKGLAKLAEYGPVLDKIERKWGVDRYVVLGVWGMETNFGGYVGDNSVIRALTTLAYARYRGNYFRHELLTALRILEEHHVKPAQMQGSWAGAMGQTQFMPTSFMRFAVDFDGDGRKDIWTSVPDALASTANYLAHHGWTRDWIWGYEAKLPRGLAAESDQKAYHPFTAWAAAGVKRADGGAMPTEGSAALVLPAGRDGPAFLVTKNFKTIKSYNNSTSYALGVALLSDRIAGSAPLVGQWPVTDQSPTGSIRREAQR